MYHMSHRMSSNSVWGLYGVHADAAHRISPLATLVVPPKSKPHPKNGVQNQLVKQVCAAYRVRTQRMNMMVESMKMRMKRMKSMV